MQGFIREASIFFLLSFWTMLLLTTFFFEKITVIILHYAKTGKIRRLFYNVIGGSQKPQYPRVPNMYSAVPKNRRIIFGGYKF